MTYNNVTDVRFKGVVFLLGDEEKMLKVWKVGGLAECQVGTTSSRDYFTLRVKRGHFYHIPMSRTHESNVFTPCSRCVHSGVSFGLGTVGGVVRM